MPDGIVFLPSFHESIKDLPDAERLCAYDAVIRYGLYGEVIDMPPLINSLFILMKPIIDASQNRYRASKENGKKGGRPPKNHTQNQTGIHTTNHDTYYEKELDSHSEREQDNAREREEESLRGEGRTSQAYKPPSEEAFEMMREQRLAQLGY